MFCCSSGRRLRQSPTRLLWLLSKSHTSGLSRAQARGNRPRLPPRTYFSTSGSPLHFLGSGCSFPQVVNLRHLFFSAAGPIHQVPVFCLKRQQPHPLVPSHVIPPRHSHQNPSSPTPSPQSTDIASLLQTSYVRAPVVEPSKGKCSCRRSLGYITENRRLRGASVSSINQFLKVKKVKVLVVQSHVLVIINCSQPESFPCPTGFP